MSAQTPFLVFSGTNSRYLAEKICNSLGCPLGQMNIQHFADGEFSVSYEESIRGRDVFLVQSTFPNSDNLMELLLMIDAAKRASAHSIIAVVPYFGWARQDRKDKPRVSIGAKLIADMLSIPAVMREELRALAGEERLAGFGHVLLRSGCKCIWSVIHRMLLHALLEENRNFKYLKSNREPRSSGTNTAPCGKSGNARRNRQRNQPISAAGYFATAASICSSVDVATPWMRNGFRYVACV